MPPRGPCLALVSAVTTSGSAAATLLTMVGLSVAFILLAVYVGQPSLVRLLDSTRRRCAQPGAHCARPRRGAVVGADDRGHRHLHAFRRLPRWRRCRRTRRSAVFSANAWKPSTACCSCRCFSLSPACAQEIGLLNDSSDWITCLAIIVVATVGKMGGTIVAARLTGLAWA